MQKSVSFSCPGCERGGFRSLMEAQEHFEKQSHSVRCTVCQKAFGSGMAVIQHYQKHVKAREAPINTKKPIQKRKAFNQHSAGPAIASPSPPGNGQMYFQETLLTAVGNTMHFREERDPINLPFSLPWIISDGTAANGNSWLGINFDTNTHPVVLHPLEQCLILRYLRSKCHSESRLRREGYILGPITVRNKHFPRKGSIPTYQFRETPSAEQPGLKRHAIALDCEMIGVKGNRQTLAFISAIDFLTGDVLIDRYVAPSEEVIDWRSKITGITQDVMTSATISGAAFRDWREARENLWKFADTSTVFVGQSLNYDLEVLGICHNKVVDSAILTAEAVFPSTGITESLPRAWSLKAVAKTLLDLEIQSGDRAHSALEDAYAVRDVIIFCIRNPEQLKSWAELRQKEEGQKGKKSRHKNKPKRNPTTSQSTRDIQLSTQVLNNEFEYDTHDDNDFCMSEYARDAGWPDGWDPWSD
ncbi:ribonuclease H-like protein [Aspergillus uvarum CBS 121591]|uniref:Ribonuclease H-like protein n=1 Tax=Aspergillus uvarum CBS 121591 TaxID=1448315 RepID=A0A319CLS9_9EURO|nr:ribonuclease H-like protein [Aspergillus uvarum CBS 121591]PYH84037.1 ribonuclease H-like protein [Aspergillus uvarum CBS 121591]